MASVQRTSWLGLICVLALSGCGGKAQPPSRDSTPIAADKSSTEMAPRSANAAAASRTSPLDGTPFASQGAVGQAQPLSSKQPSMKYRNGKLVGDDSLPVIEVISEFDGSDNGKVAVPAYPGDVLYMGLNVQTEAGSPLKGKDVQISSKKGNHYVLMSERTDEQGYFEFRVLASQMGRDVITVSAAGVRTDFYVDVSEAPKSQWLTSFNLHDVTPWDVLLTADVQLARDHVDAAFPFMVEQLRDRTVRLVGFMMPLGITEKQKHFLFSANPPSCFFHPPGGPASAVEVTAERPIAMTYDPIVIEGHFKLISHSDGGIIYKLDDARQVKG